MSSEHGSRVGRALSAPRPGVGLLIAVGGPALVTAIGFAVDYRRIAIPALLYLLAVVAAVWVGRLAAGLAAGAASGLGLAILVGTQARLSGEGAAQDVLAIGLFFVVALVLAYAIATVQTARRAAEAAEHDLRLLIDGAGDTALFKLDGSGRVASWNPGAERLLGYSIEEAIGLELAAFLPEEDDRNGEAAALLAASQRDEAQQVEGWRVRKDGSRLWAHATLTPMHDASGRSVGFAHVIRDLTGRKRLEDELSALALQDSLTRLPNRALFHQHLAGAVARARRHGSIVALLFLDLDDFKAVNDTHGHAAGDELLLLVSDRLRAAVRATDFVARLGGDEFTVLCENVTDAAEAEAVAERVVQALRRPFVLEGAEIMLAVSVGVSVAEPETTTPERLLERADAAMYRAKTGGGATFRLWSEEPQEGTGG